jgi:hypothetical protein
MTGRTSTSRPAKPANGLDRGGLEARRADLARQLQLLEVTRLRLQGAVAILDELLGAKVEPKTVQHGHHDNG